MLISIKVLSCAGRRCSGLLAALAVLLPVCGIAQQANLLVNQSAQPVMYLGCAYSQGTVFYLASVFTVAPAEVGQAQSAWRQYAQSQAGNQPVSAQCRVSRDQNSIGTIRQAEQQALTSKWGQQVKFVDVNWRFTPTQTAAMPQARAVSASPYGQTGMAYNQQPPTYNQVSNQTYNQPYSQTRTGNAAADNASPQGTATGSSPVSGITSNLAQTGQSMKDNAMNTGTTMASNVSQMATDTTAQFQKAATDKLTSFLQRKHAKPDTTQPQAQAQPGQAQPVANTNLVAENKQPAAALAVTPAATAVAPPTAQTGPSFIACHVAASDAEYLSEVFPVMEADDTKLRYAFWQMIGQKYKNGPVAFSTVSCKRAATEQEAESHRTAATDAAVQRGVTPDHVVKTGWSYMGQ